MAKLYAEITSDKGGRVASKGGDNFITVSIYHGNCKVFTVEHNYENNEYSIFEDTENAIIVINGDERY
jgi:hypothetical protein